MDDVRICAVKADNRYTFVRKLNRYYQDYQVDDMSWNFNRKGQFVGILVLSEDR